MPGGCRNTRSTQRCTDEAIAACLLSCRNGYLGFARSRPRTRPPASARPRCAGQLKQPQTGPTRPPGARCPLACLLRRVCCCRTGTEPGKRAVQPAGGDAAVFAFAAPLAVEGKLGGGGAARTPLAKRPWTTLDGWNLPLPGATYRSLGGTASGTGPANSARLRGARLPPPARAVTPGRAN